jgi:hypothetical protein
VQGDEKVVKILSRYEPVEWKYDGLNGKIIPWTLENGGTSHDPSVLAFVVTPGETVVAMCPGGKTYQASGFSKWLREQADAYEREHPRTVVPLIRASVVEGGRGDTRLRCPELDDSIEAGKPVLLYLGREGGRNDDKTDRKQVKAARAFEKKHFDSKSNAKAAEGWTLLRLDLADEEHAAFAKTLGIEAVPAVLAYLPGESEPVDLTRKLRSGSLAYQLRKLAPRDD